MAVVVAVAVSAVVIVAVAAVVCLMCPTTELAEYPLTNTKELLEHYPAHP